jgi:hypothetical protein
VREPRRVASVTPAALEAAQGEPAGGLFLIYARPKSCRNRTGKRLTDRTRHHDCRAWTRCVGAVPWKRGTLAAPFAQAHPPRSLLRSPIRCPSLHRRFLSASAILVRSAVKHISPIQRSRLPARPGTFLLDFSGPCLSDAISLSAARHSQPAIASCSQQRLSHSPAPTLWPSAPSAPPSPRHLSAAVSDLVAVLRPAAHLVTARRLRPPSVMSSLIAANTHQSPFASPPLILVSRPLATQSLQLAAHILSPHHLVAYV